MDDAGLRLCPTFTCEVMISKCCKWMRTKTKKFFNISSWDSHLGAWVCLLSLRMSGFLLSQQTCNRSGIPPFVHSHKTFLDQLVSGPPSFPSHNNVVSKGFHHWYAVQQTFGWRKVKAGHFGSARWFLPSIFAGDAEGSKMHDKA
jgi:hypothetical protein